MKILKTCGYKIAILSGGFTYFGEYLQRRYGIDYVYANELEVGEDGKLTGRYVGEIVDGHRKAELLKLAIIRTGTGQALFVVVREKKLEIGFSVFLNLGCICENLGAVTVDRIYARSNETAGAFNLTKAHTASADFVDFF